MMSSRFVRARLIVVLGALSAFGPVTTDVYLPGLPRAAAALRTDESGIQSSLTACLLGLAVGQLLVGPVSDAMGRRRPLLMGMLAFGVASVLCATAVNIAELDVYRLCQGLTGSTGIVVCTAIVRDLYHGRQAARAYSVLMAVGSISPVVAPLVGSELLRIMDWRGIFVTLACLGLVFAAAAWLWIDETLPPERRSTGGIVARVATLRRLLSDRRFTGYVSTGSLAFAALFAYISASSFVFQDSYHLSPQAFGVVFAVNSLVLLTANSLNTRLVLRYLPARLLRVGLTAVVVGAMGVPVALLVNYGGAWAVEVSLMIALFGIGLILPNATALALNDYADAAGSASAVVGLVKYTLGAAVAPLVGLAGTSPFPMSMIIVAASVLAVLTLRLSGSDTGHRRALAGGAD